MLCCYGGGVDGREGIERGEGGGEGGRKQIELKLITRNNTLISLWGEEWEDKGGATHSNLMVPLD